MNRRSEGISCSASEEGIGTDNARNIRMKDANGFHLDITQGTEERHMNYERIQIRN